MKSIVSLMVLMLGAALPMFAHHSFAAEYGSKLIMLNGTITRFFWTNPHTRIYLDVTDARGTVMKWECEGSSPGGLLSNGWTRGSLNPGDHVTIEGYPAKDRSGVCKVRTVKLANGNQLIMGWIGASGP